MIWALISLIIILEALLVKILQTIKALFFVILLMIVLFYYLRF